MSKLVVFSDLHLFKWREFTKLTKEGRNDRLMDCVSVFKQVRKLAEKVSADGILFLGDLFHKRSILDTETFNLGVDGIDSLSPWQVVLVPGNHDQATRDGSIHSLEPFRHLRHVIVASHEQPLVWSVSGVKILAIPYTDRDALVGTFKNTTHDLALLHAGFSGAMAGSYEYRPPEELEVADLGPLPKGRTSVLVGHYHKPQSLVGDKVVYIGAPIQHTRSDAGEKRGIGVWDSKTGKLTRYPLDLPRFVTLTQEKIDSSDASEWDIEGNFVDIVLDEEPDGGIEAFRKTCNKLPARGVNIVFTPPPSLPECRLDVDPSMDLGQMLTKYVDEYAPKELDKKKLNTLMKELLP